MVTKATDAEINKMKSDYIALAKEMHVSLSTVTDAAEAWLRTGMNETDATEALRASTILATDAFMEGSEATQYLVAAQKAYGLEANELIGVVDKLTTLDTKAATTAADLGEALSLSASSAGLAGISMDKYLAILATASETTQQSASNIGNAWKTILARLQQVKLGSALDEEGQDISNVDKLLKEYGIDLMKTTDNLENMEALLDELGQNWERYTAKQKSEIATVVAGTRQRDKLIATLNNYDRVMELTDEAHESSGAAMKKFNIYADSTEAKINDLKTGWKELADATLKSNVVEWFITAATNMEKFATSAGGLIPILVELGAVIAGLEIGGPAGFMVGSIIGIGAALYQGVSQIQNEQIERLKKEAEETEKNSKAKVEERGKISDLMSEYVSLNAIKERTKEQDERLTEITNELSAAYGEQSSAISGLKDAYEGWIELYQRSIFQSYTDQIEDLQKKANELESTFGTREMYRQEGGTYYRYTEKVAPSKEAEDQLESLREQIKSLQAAYDTASASAQEFKEFMLGTKEWDRSADGAKKLKTELDSIKKILDSFSVTKDGTISEDLKELYEYYLKFYNAILSQYKEFVSTDFILTEYYDKRLKDLKEQKELEDELAKQKEKQEKLESSELKKQEALLEVEKARAELAKAKEKRIQVFRMGKGLVYEEDTENIANAQEELTKALDNYASAVKDYDKVFADLYGKATEQLISAVEELENVYGYVQLQNPAVREYFQTPEKREEFMGLSQADQLNTLLEFLKGTKDEEDVRSKVYSEIAALGPKAVEQFGLSGIIPDTESNITGRGAEVQGSVFGEGTDGASVVQRYLSEKTTKEGGNMPSVTNGWKSYKEAADAGYANIAGASESERSRVKAWKNPYTGEKYKNYQEYLDAMYLKYVEGKEPTYHTGGIVGQPSFKSDTEMYAKLLKGEIVLPQNKFNNIIEKVRASTTNNSSVMNIGNISLPNVTDTDSFVSELQKISYAKA